MKKVSRKFVGFALLGGALVMFCTGVINFTDFLDMCPYDLLRTEQLLKSLICFLISKDLGLIGEKILPND